ncbi:phosphoribulokinase/uridine kinase family protein [Pseudonocardia sediminis]|uniref:Phosphoribulokinase/uridine kinase family protein n=1 Tax=Pseudonocardia sediminis TaxID=1397368 RepID=A0A4Q7V0J8_PSEST|nr:nucleoside/nucleotide kinase family protein [Pseudonocardia sediminis]RZT86103.1 phosphoribulokinase/uridine kinase family protein [Pseudonocardia sediminis]
MDLAGTVRELVGDGRRRVLLGVTGAPGAGKTTLVEGLRDALRASPPPGCEPGTWVAHVPMDGFHLADAGLERLGLRDRKGAAETFDAHGYLALLRRLRADTGETVWAPAFERDLEQPLAGAIDVPAAARLVLTEGNYLLLPDDPWPAVAAELDRVWFVDPPDDLRLRRLIARHEEFGKSPAHAARWVQDVDEPNAARVRATRDRADLVIDEAG